MMCGPHAGKLAYENGFYVIVQSGKAVEILPTPEGFVAREWEGMLKKRLKAVSPPPRADKNVNSMIRHRLFPRGL